MQSRRKGERKGKELEKKGVTGDIKGEKKTIGIYRRNRGGRNTGIPYSLWALALTTHLLTH